MILILGVGFLFAMALAALVVASVAYVKAFGGYAGTMAMAPINTGVGIISLTPGSTAASGSVRFDPSGAAAGLDVEMELIYSHYGTPKAYQLTPAVPNTTKLYVNALGSAPTFPQPGRLLIDFAATGVVSSIIFYYTAL